MISKESVVKLQEIGAKRVFVQAPEGLKTRIQSIAKWLEGKGFKVFVSCEPCFGGCDLRDWEALALKCQALLHIGHTDFGVNAKLPVVYEKYAIEFDVRPLLEKIQLKEKKVALATTSQFFGVLETVKEYLEGKGKEVYIGEHKRAGTHGQVLGCDASAAIPLVEDNMDCVLFLGSGKFHPLGIALKTEKPVYWLDFETHELRDMEKERGKYLQVKAWNLEKAKEAGKFGILLTTKPGQMLLGQAERVKKDLEEKGKEAWILVMDLITPEKILGLDLDVLINCACPRMEEDHKVFGKPVLNPVDVSRI